MRSFGRLHHCELHATPGSDAARLHGLMIDLPTIKWEQYRGKFRNNPTLRQVVKQLKEAMPEVQCGHTFLRRKKSHKNPSKVYFAECGGLAEGAITPSSKAEDVKSWFEEHHFGQVEALSRLTGRELLAMSPAELRDKSPNGHLIHATLRGQRGCV